MIVTNISSPARTLGSEGENIRWRSLARRGMLHSECESFDHVRLAPGTEFALYNRHAAEQVWFIVRGTGKVSDGPAGVNGHQLHEGDLVAAPHGDTEIVLRAGPTGLDALWLTVLPVAISSTLPGRKPVIS